MQICIWSGGIGSWRCANLRMRAATLNRAVTLDPKKLDAPLSFGLSHYFLGEFAQSAEAFHHAVDLAPDTDSRINSTNWLYASLRRANKREEAARR